MSIHNEYETLPEDVWPLALVSFPMFIGDTVAIKYAS